MTRWTPHPAGRRARRSACDPGTPSPGEEIGLWAAWSYRAPVQAVGLGAHPEQPAEGRLIVLAPRPPQGVHSVLNLQPGCGVLSPPQRRGENGQPQPRKVTPELSSEATRHEQLLPGAAALLCRSEIPIRTAQPPWHRNREGSFSLLDQAYAGHVRTPSRNPLGPALPPTAAGGPFPRRPAPHWTIRQPWHSGGRDPAHLCGF